MLLLWKTLQKKTNPGHKHTARGWAVTQSSVVVQTTYKPPIDRIRKQRQVETVSRVPDEVSF